MTSQVEIEKIQVLVRVISGTWSLDDVTLANALNTPPDTVPGNTLPENNPIPYGQLAGADFVVLWMYEGMMQAFRNMAPPRDNGGDDGRTMTQAMQAVLGQIKEGTWWPKGVGPAAAELLRNVTPEDIAAARAALGMPPNPGQATTATT